MLRKIIVLTLLFVLVGCASTSPEEWRQYARGAYLQGVADGKSSVTCRPVVHLNTIMVSPQVAPACEQAKVDAASTKAAAEQADYDLTNSKKERQRSLYRYIELGGKAAQ